jgi:membrane associated rhomboid family serine protease
MLDNFVSQVQAVIVVMQANMPAVLKMVGVLWIIQIFNWFVDYRLNCLGIIPRRVRGLVGIVCSPFLHGNFNHLFFNSIPFVVLSCLVLLNGWVAFIYVTVIAALLGGIATWLFARMGSHVGASGVIMGYWSYLMVEAYYQPSWLSFVLAGVCIYYFGSFILHVVPTSARSSWEGHLFGFLAGIFAAYSFPSVIAWIQHL